MNRLDALEIIMLLSALESWCFSTEERLPDYLADRISMATEKLTHEIIDEQDNKTL